MDKNFKWDWRFMNMAALVSSWSTCIRRKVGAVIVRDKRVIATGYNGAPAGHDTCEEKHVCIREEQHIPSGTQTEKCYAVHAEQNAIIQAAKLGIPIQGVTLYCTHKPCSGCMKSIINAGILRVVYCEGYPDPMTEALAAACGVQLEVMKP